MSASGGKWKIFQIVQVKSVLNILNLNLFHRLQSSSAEIGIKLEQLTADKEELLSIVYKRNSEIEKLSQDVKNLSDQLQSATMAKIEALVKVDELTSKEMELDYK